MQFSSRMGFLSRWPVGLTLAVGLLLTVLATLYTHANVQAIAQREFALMGEEIAAKIRDRLHAHAQILRGGAAFFMVSGHVDRNQWRAFIEYNRIPLNLPGVQGVGFARRIAPEQRAAHIQAIRAEGFPDYQVWPEGERAVYSSIIYLEPFSGRNLRAFGYDMFSEPVRRAAMEQARDQDVAALSGKVHLVQETDRDVQAGALMYVPVYRADQPRTTVEERRAALVGWVYSPYRMNDLMRGILGNRPRADDTRHLHLAVYDEAVAPNTLLFDSRDEGNSRLDPDTPAELFLPIDFNGHRWTLGFSRSDPGLGWSNGLQPVVVGGTGVCISGLLALLVGAFLKTRVQAIRLTAELQGRQQVEAALRANEKILEDAQRLAGLGHWSWDLDGDRHAWSDEIYRLYGRDPGLPPALYPEVQGYFTPESWSRLAAAVERARIDGIPYECEAEVVRPDGGHGWILARGEATRDAGGRILKLSGTVLDITNRKRAERAAHQAQARFHRLMDANMIGVVIARTSGEILEANDYYLTLAGCTRAELADGAVDWRALTPPEWLPADEQAIVELHERGVCTPYEKEYRRRDGSRVMVLITDALLPESGSILGLILDITERKRAEHQLQASLAEKTLLIKEIHHRVKNNMQVIVSLVSLQAAQVPHPATQEALQDTQGRIRSMALLHETLYQRGALGRVDGAVYLAHLCEQMSQAFGHMAGRVRLVHQLDSVELTLDQAIPCGLIVNELVSNAFKHAFPGDRHGEIRVVLSEGEQGPRVLAVLDDGVGMPPDLDWRDSPSLGLQLVPGLAAQIGGELQRQDGPGTRFFLNFPAS